MSSPKKIRNDKEKVVFELIKEKWPKDDILVQYKFCIPYKYNKIHSKNTYLKYPLGKSKATYYTPLSKEYIRVDFFNRTKQIIVEVDYIGHSSPNAKREDAARDKQLKKRGYKVIRLGYDIGFIEGVKRLLDLK